MRPLRLTKAPRGAGAVSSAAVGRAYAGPFNDLRATGTTTTRALPCASRTASRATGSRRAGPRPAAPAAAARYTADVLFPSWGGRARASWRCCATAPRDRRHAASPLSSIAYLWVRSERSGYVVVPASRPAGAGVHIMRPAAQSSDPRPGPDAADPDRPRGTLQPRHPVRPPHARAQRAGGSGRGGAAELTRPLLSEPPEDPAELLAARPLSSGGGRRHEPLSAGAARREPASPGSASGRSRRPSRSAQYVYRTGLCRVSMWTPGICMNL